MAPIIESLRERKIVQWGLAYLAGAWVAYQLLAELGEPRGITDATLVSAQWVLGAGFLITLIAAWFHGERGNQRVSPTEVVLVATVVVATIGLVVFRAPGPGDVATDPVPPSEIPVLTVLPFDDLSGQPDDGLMADGLHMEVTARLVSQLGGVLVRPRESAITYKGSALPAVEAARALDADYVLTGSVRVMGEQLRFTSTLTDVHRDVDLWAQSIDGAMSSSGLFALQDSIAELVSNALEVEFRDAQTSRVSDSDVAYRLYLQGSGLSDSPSMSENRTAEVLLRQAIDFDGDFAAAQAKLAATLARRAQVFAGGRAAADSAALHAQRALELDAEEPEAWVALGVARQNQGRFHEALEAHQRAIELAPRMAAPRREASFLLFMVGRLDEAAAEQRALLRIAPDEYSVLGAAGSLLALVGAYDRAERLIETALEAEPGQPAVRSYRLQLLAARGQWERARADADEWLQSQAGNPFAYAVAASVALREGDAARAGRLAGAAHLMAPELRGFIGFTLRTVLGHALILQGDTAAASDLLGSAIQEGRDLVAAGDDRPGVFFDVASAYASLGEREEALRWLESARAAGWLHDEWVPQGLAAFSAMSDDPSFVAWRRASQRTVSEMSGPVTRELAGW